MDKMEENLITYLQQMNIAKAILSQLKSTDIESMDFQLALCECLDIDSMNPVELIERNLTHQKMLSLLKDYDFSKNLPDVLTIITVDESLLPDGIPKLLTEQTVKVKGEVWVIHKSDVDPFPSSPHAHNYDSGISLHLGTGEFFNKKQSKGFLNCKKLNRLRGEIKGHSLPSLSERCKKPLTN